MKNNTQNIDVVEFKEFIKEEYCKNYILYEYQIQKLKELTEEFQTKYKLESFNNGTEFNKVLSINFCRSRLNGNIDDIFEDIKFLNKSLNVILNITPNIETKSNIFNFFKKIILDEDDDLLSQERKHGYIEKFHKLLEHFLIDSK